MGELSKKDQALLDATLNRIQTHSEQFLGYPVSKDFDYSNLFEFLKYPINNLGDPFTECTYAVDTREMEREVIAFFAELFRADPDDYWGYVTGGGTEGNLYGLYLARELHPKGMVYYSEATHYSVHKNLHLLGMPSIVIRSQENGEIDYQDLEQTIRLNRHIPVIMFANIGTTMTEGKDDIAKIQTILKRNAIPQYYVHCDGALAGSFSPFLNPKPSFDFADGADSISISGHKFIGSPIPSGVVIAKKRNRDRIARSIAYIDSLDTTIGGSRNGTAALFLWYAIKTHGREGFLRRINHSLEVAAYAETAFEQAGIQAWRNPNAITVVFEHPGKTVRDKWQLASEGEISHLICMPNVSKEQIDALIQDILKYKSDQKEVKQSAWS